MDPYIERDMIECLRSMAISLKSIDLKLEKIEEAVREANADLIIEDDSESRGEENSDPTIKFEVADDDSISEGEGEKEAKDGEEEI